MCYYQSKNSLRSLTTKEKQQRLPHYLGIAVSHRHLLIKILFIVEFNEEKNKQVSLNKNN